MGNTINVQGSYIDVHDNENVYLSVDKAKVSMGQESSEDSPTLTTELLGEAMAKVMAYVWGNAAYAVVFCVCRDVYGWQDNASYFERQLAEIGKEIPAGTINAALSRNPYMRLSVDKWKGYGVMERVLILKDKFCEQADALMAKV